MKKNNIIILCIFVFAFILLANCVKEEEKIISCDEFPDYDECVCPEGLTKDMTLGGYFCHNVTCEGYLLSNGSCVDECPEGFTYISTVDIGYHAPLCVPEWYYSEERTEEERSCEKDSDCVWDEYESFQCCKCGLEIMNKKTKERNKAWREKNCKGPRDYSEWKWRNCPDNPGYEPCFSDKKESLVCRYGKCFIKKWTPK